MYSQRRNQAIWQKRRRKGPGTVVMFDITVNNRTLGKLDTAVKNILRIVAKALQDVMNL